MRSLAFLIALGVLGLTSCRKSSSDPAPVVVPNPKVDVPSPDVKVPDYPAVKVPDYYVPTLQENLQKLGGAYRVFGIGEGDAANRDVNKDFKSKTQVRWMILGPQYVSFLSETKDGFKTSTYAKSVDILWFNLTPFPAREDGTVASEEKLNINHSLQNSGIEATGSFIKGSLFLSPVSADEFANETKDYHLSADNLLEHNSQEFFATQFNHELVDLQEIKSLKNFDGQGLITKIESEYPVIFVIHDDLPVTSKAIKDAKIDAQNYYLDDERLTSVGDSYFVGKYDEMPSSERKSYRILRDENIIVLSKDCAGKLKVCVLDAFVKFQLSRQRAVRFSAVGEDMISVASAAYINSMSALKDAEKSESTLAKVDDPESLTAKLFHNALISDYARVFKYFSAYLRFQCSAIDALTIIKKISSQVGLSDVDRNAFEKLAESRAKEVTSIVKKTLEKMLEKHNELKPELQKEGVFEFLKISFEEARTFLEKLRQELN